MAGSRRKNKIKSDYELSNGDFLIVTLVLLFLLAVAWYYYRKDNY